MSDMASVAALLGCIAEAHDAHAPLTRLQERIRMSERLRPGRSPHSPTDGTYIQSGMWSAQEVVVGTFVQARRPDERLIVWTVEVWFNSRSGGDVQATIRGRVEEDDAAGQPRHRFSVDCAADKIPEVVSAFREIAELVAAYQFLD